MPGSIQSLERAAAILQLVAEYPARLGLTEIHETLDLAKATAHGLLRTLASVGFVEQLPDTGKYRLGTGLTELGQLRLDPNELRSHAVNWTDSLAGRTGQAVRVAAFSYGSADAPVIVHHVFRPDDTVQHLDTGIRIPAHATALGKVLLAWSPAFRTRTPVPLEPYTGHTVTAATVLARYLITVRRQGWAADVEEFSIGEAGLAAPVRGAGGRVVAAIGVSGPVESVLDGANRPQKPLLRQVIETAHSVSRDLATLRR